MISKIGKHSNFFAKRKLNYLWPLKLTVYFLLTLSTIFVPILVNSVFIDTKHTLRYDGEVNIGKLIINLFRTELLYFNKQKYISPFRLQSLWSTQVSEYYLLDTLNV